MRAAAVGHGGTDVLKDMPEPKRQQIHVLVKLPPSTGASVPIVPDSSAEWLEQFLAAQIPFDLLPSVDELSNFIQEAIPVKLACHRLICSDGWSHHCP